MRARTVDAFEPYLARIREIPFVRAATVRAPDVRARHRRLDGIVVVKTPDDMHELPVELKRTYLTYATADGVLAQMKALTPKPWILFAPYIPRPLGQHLAEHDANYMDLAGNCRLVLGNRYVAHVEGRTRERAAEERRGLRVPGYQVLFAILAEPELLNATVRRLADAAGTGKTAAAETLRRLQDENLIGEVKGRRFILEAKILLERWIAGYATHVRPRLLIGTYRTADRDPEALERHVEEVLADKLTWGFGGGAAAARLARFYRGERTVVHLEKAPPDLQKRLQAQRVDNGPLVLLRAPGQIAFNGVKPRTVHPLLIYTELLVTDDPRAREAANEVWDRHLGHLR
jgi:hypothetical protein